MRPEPPLPQLQRRATVRLPVAVILVAAAGLTTVLTGRPDAAILATPWLVVLVLGSLTVTRPSIEASVMVTDPRVMIGDELELVTTLSTEPSPGRWAEVNCRPEWESPKPPPTVEAIRSDPTTLSCTLAAPHWGTFDVGRVTYVVNEPYALVRWKGEVDKPTRVRVHPDPQMLDRLLAPWHVRRVSGAHRSRTVGSGVEYADLREYVAGDSLRDINWRASARSEDLWVSQRHSEQMTDVVLLLDSFIESGHDVRTVVGLAIEAAIGLAESHLAVTDRVGLIEIGGVLNWVSPGTGPVQLQRLTDALLSTGLYANAAERSLAMIPPRALPPRSFIVALSPLLDPRFINALRLLRAGGHDVGVIACPPLPRDFTASDTGPGQIAHRLWSLEREMTEDRLAHHGIGVARWEIDQPITPALVDLDRLRRHLSVGVGR